MILKGQASVCAGNHATMQFQNIWEKELLKLAEFGFAKAFDRKQMKQEGTKVAVIGGGPAGMK